MDSAEKDFTDEQIVLMIQKGDKEKFGILMKRYDQKLSRYGQKFLSRKETIEDIVQDVFISTFENINSFKPSLKFSSWIYRIAHNAFINGLKKQEHSPIPFFDFDTFISHPIYEDPIEKEREFEEINKLVEIGLDKLKPKYKEAIILHYIEDLSYKEISDILQIPVGTVGIRIMRGREALKDVYQKMEVNLKD